MEHECSEPVDRAFCIEPCKKKLQCGHQCTGKCGEPCKACPACKVAFDKFKRDAEKRVKEIEAKFKRDAEKRVKEIEAKIKATAPRLAFEELKKSPETLAEFTQVADKVEKYVQPMHNWRPNITKITRVINLALEVKFERAKTRAFGHNIDQKFHGTGDAGIEGITRNGFRMGTGGMYGGGIYFATDSSKSAQSCYTKGSNKLLLCDVLLGRSMVVNQSNGSLNGDFVRQSGFDSVYAPRGTAVANDEFIIYHPDQALPR